MTELPEVIKLVVRWRRPMTKLAEIQERLLETNAAIGELEKAIANDPKSLSLDGD